MKDLFYILFILLIAGTMYFLSPQFPINQAPGNAIGGRTETKTAISAVSATTTSDIIDISNANRVTLGFTVSDLRPVHLGTSTFSVEVSVDGTNFIAFNKLVDNLTNTNSQTLTRIASMVLDTNTSDYLSMDLGQDTFKFMKVTAGVMGTTTSKTTVTALVDY